MAQYLDRNFRKEITQLYTWRQIHLEIPRIALSHSELWVNIKLIYTTEIIINMPYHPKLNYIISLMIDYESNLCFHFGKTMISLYEKEHDKIQLFTS